MDKNSKLTDEELKQNPSVPIPHKKEGTAFQ